MSRKFHFFFLIEISKRIHIKRCIVSILNIVHCVTYSRITAHQIIQCSVMSCHSDTRFFTGIAPMHNIMTAAKTFQITEMVYINICTVTAHCLCHSENIFSARTHKCKPQPQCRYKFGILPSVTAHIISPTMTLCVICVHYIAVIPKTVPMSLFDFVLIKCKCFVKFFFKPFFKRCIL